jgi:hypothetical protein
MGTGLGQEVEGFGAVISVVQEGLVEGGVSSGLDQGKDGVSQ